MGLFDTIERLSAADGQLVNPRPRAQLLPQPPAGADTALKKPAADHVGKAEQAATESGPDIWSPSPAELAERQRILNRKPEPLSFLAPCPVCHGRAFLNIDGGGFVCRTCTPGLFGYPAEAAGPDRPGLPADVDLLPAGDSHETGATPQPTGSNPTEEQRSHFSAAWPWIKENKAELLAAGWTLASLVRRSKFRWPYGLWGVAWLPVWSKPGVVVALGPKGEITFTFSSGGRTITQSTAQKK
jgi:hypothetical protein